MNNGQIISPSPLFRATSLYAKVAFARCKTAHRTICPTGAYRSALFSSVWQNEKISDNAAAANSAHIRSSLSHHRRNTESTHSIVPCSILLPPHYNHRVFDNLSGNALVPHLFSKTFDRDEGTMPMQYQNPGYHIRQAQNQELHLYGDPFKVNWHNESRQGVFCKGRFYHSLYFLRSNTKWFWPSLLCSTLHPKRISSVSSFGSIAAIINIGNSILFGCFSSVRRK